MTPRPIDDLSRTLFRIDGRGYKAYKDISGSYMADAHTLHIDHVQGDPFAEPSKIRLRVQHDVSQIPRDLYSNRVRRIALQDLLTRRFSETILKANNRSRGSGKSGLIFVDAGHQEVLERTSCLVTDEFVEIRAQIGLPAASRSVLGREADCLLTTVLADLVAGAMLWENLPQADVELFINCVENQEHVRDQLRAIGAIAFVADGAILPRASGATDKPMAIGDAVGFRSPDSLQTTVSLLYPIQIRGKQVDAIAGMAIPEGVTLIVGGGYHGKSTLLKAIERSVYPHVPGDGREYVITRRDAVKIRAEDGRRVHRVDISGFINNLPQQRSTREFCSEDASGSTSQAANIAEAIEIGSKLLLLDEDTCATNFMMRDARMQELVQREQEPITPLVDRVRELYTSFGVSSILVMGGCGDYFDVADTVIQMTEFMPSDVTDRAKTIAERHVTGREVEVAGAFESIVSRIPQRSSFDASRGKRDVKIDARGLDRIVFGKHDIDLRGLEQLVDPSQTRAIGDAIHYACEHLMAGEVSLANVVEQLEFLFDQHGLDFLAPLGREGEHPGNYARPRRFEIAATINRLRTLSVTIDR